MLLQRFSECIAFFCSFYSFPGLDTAVRANNMSDNVLWALLIVVYKDRVWMRKPDDTLSRKGRLITPAEYEAVVGHTWVH